MSNAVISRAGENDIRDLVVLTSEYLQEVASAAGRSGFVPDREKIGEKLAEFLDMPDFAVFVARSSKGHPLGFVMAFQMPVQIREEPFAILERLYVRPDYRRRRIAHQLLEDAKRFARSRKCRRLQVTLSAFFVLEDALAFFNAEKFYETGGRKHKIAL